MKNPSCSRISGSLTCTDCEGKLQKAGRQKNGAQKLFCSHCKKYSQAVYQNKACAPGTDRCIIAYLKRNKTTLRTLLSPMIYSPKTIFYTDCLPIYRYLIPLGQQGTFSKCTNPST